MKAIYMVFSAYAILSIFDCAWAFNLSVSGTPEKVSVGEEVTFTCVPSGGVPPYSYQWDFDDIATYKNNDTLDTQNQTHLFDWPGSYSVNVNVTDAEGNEETGIILIDVNTGATAMLDAQLDCGLVGDGITDDGPALRTCIDGLDRSTGAKIVFKPGTYIIGDQTSGIRILHGRTGISIRYKQRIELVGSNGENQPIILFRNDYTNDDNEDALIGYDNTPIRYDLLLKNIHFKMDLQGKTHSDFSQTSVIAGLLSDQSHITIEQCTIENFTIVSRIKNLRFVRNNILGWGKFNTLSPNNPGGRSEAIYLQGNSFFKQNYISQGNEGHSHLIYSGGTGTTNRDYVYIIDNYMDAANGYGNAWGMHFYGEDGSTLQFKYVFGNIIKNVTRSGVIMGIFGGPEYNSQHLAIENNIFDNCHTGITVWKSHDDVSIKNNQFQNIPSNPIISLGRFDTSEVQGIKFTDNVFGKNAGSDGGGTIHYNALNYGTTFSPNKDDLTYVDTIDPGIWEFSPPSNISVSVNGNFQLVSLQISVQDNGSGMGVEPIWPLKKGGLIQLSNDGINWSEARDFSEEEEWSLSSEKQSSIYVRFRDRNGNWSAPFMTAVSISELLPPDNVRIGFAGLN